MSNVAIIDGDVLVFRAAWKAEKTLDWGDDLYSIAADLKEARGLFDSMVHDVLLAVDAKIFVVALSDGRGTFREKIFPSYKGARHKFGTRKPIVFNPLRDWLREHTANADMRDGLEGDDVMGILSGSDKVLCTIDKDLNTIPGKHYNFDTKKLFRVTETEADHFHMEQTCAGDPTDGVPGIPGIGMKSARKWLTTKGYSWAHVLELFEKNGFGKDYCTLQAQLTRILRPGEYIQHLAQPLLFQPNYL